MENFFYEDRFCSELSDLMDVFDITEENIKDLDENWSVSVMASKLEKIFQFEQKFVVDAIVQQTDTWEERFPEESDSTFEAIEKAIKAGIDIDKINSLLPSIWYPTDGEFIITKQDLIDYIG